MLSLWNTLSIICILISCLVSVSGLSTPKHTTNKAVQSNNSSRRSFISTSIATAFFTAIPKNAQARYILNDETGEFDEVQDDDWKIEWGKRAEKAKSMSKEDIFLAAQGAGNTELREGEESEASKKRRAFAGCRNDSFRQKSNTTNEKECTKRVMGGDYQFMVDVMN